MNRNLSFIIWTLVLVLTIVNLVLVFSKSKETAIIPEENILFMDRVTQCPSDTNTSDRFVCLYNLADAIKKETNTLAEKLISQATTRLQEIKINDDGPAPFEYGGEDFLTALPIQIEKAQKNKDEYINSVCNLSSMSSIFGGSGMDLEQEACRYYFTNEYLQILKNFKINLDK